VCEICWEPVNGFAPNSHGRRVWSLARTSLKVSGHQGQKRRFSTLSAACVRFMFGKTSLASSFGQVRSSLAVRVIALEDSCVKWPLAYRVSALL